MRQGQLPEVLISLRTSDNILVSLFCLPCRCSKVWDTYTGNLLHSFPHNHIVRSVALSPTSSHLLTGGQEKKVRMFDLGRPDADPDYLGEPGALSHEGTVKSVVWVGDHTGVTAGEDGFIK